MMNLTLYRREMKGSIRLLLIFGAVMTLYISIIISMYDPEMMKTLDNFAEVMPDLMASVGMKAHASNLLALIARYVDKGSMLSLIAAPVKRCTIAFTQMSVLISGIVLLIFYSTILELTCAAKGFPGELDIPKLLALNGGLLCLHLFIGSICFLASCLFSDTKYSLALGAGVPALMYVLQMLANVGGTAEKAKYFTFFTLFNADGLIAGKSSAVLGVVILLAGAVLLYTLGILAFNKKDLYL